MSIPNSPSSKGLADNLIRVGKSVKTYRTSLKGTINWNVKVGSQNKIPDAAFKKLSRAAQFFREGHYSLEDIKNIKDQGNKTKEVLNKTKEVADKVKKSTDMLEKINKVLFRKIPGSNALDSASRVGGILGILSAIGFVALTKLQEEISDGIFNNLDAINISAQKTLTLISGINNKVTLAERKLNKFERELDVNAKDYYRLNKQQERFGATIAEVKKQSNEALYEARQGRTIVEAKIAEVKNQSNEALYEARQGRTIVETKIAEAKKQANDALYETRQNKSSIESKITEQRTNLEAKIQQINAQIAKFTSGVSDSFQNSVNATISKIQSDLAATRSKVDAIRPTTPVDTSAINANAIAAAKAIITPLQSQIAQLFGTVVSFQGQVAQIPVIAGAVGNLAVATESANAKADAAMNEARNKGMPNLAPLQQQLDDKFNQLVEDNKKSLNIQGLQMSNLFKEFEQRNKDFERSTKLTADQRQQEFVDQNIKTLATTDLKLSNLSKEFDRRNAEFFAQSTKTSQENYENIIEQNKQALAPIKSEMGSIKSDLKTTTTDLTKIDTKLKEQEKVNDLALPKLDQILGILPLIPARAADAIKPSIPTIPQIETAAATGTCRTTQSGGCMSKALGDNAANITNANNANTNNILNALNAGANAAQLGLLNTINNKMGEQLPGGLSGKLQRFSQWLHLDRALNLMIWATTIHNAAMLSNNLGQTLLSAIGNILSVVGLKDAEGQAFDIGSIISKGIEGLVKSAIGEENYTVLNANWKKASRIYQAAANLLNSIQSLSSSILNGLEVVGQWNAKVANALKRFGVVGEKAYSWMNPNVNFQNKYFTALENATNVISQVDQVASEVLSIKETVGQIVEQKKELDDSLKETDASKQKTDLPEAVKVAQKETEAKTASAALPVSENDKEPDED